MLELWIWTYPFNHPALRIEDMPWISRNDSKLLVLLPWCERNTDTCWEPICVSVHFTCYSVMHRTPFLILWPEASHVLRFTSTARDLGLLYICPLHLSKLEASQLVAGRALWSEDVWRFWSDIDPSILRLLYCRLLSFISDVPITHPLTDTPQCWGGRGEWEPPSHGAYIPVTEIGSGQWSK